MPWDSSPLDADVVICGGGLAGLCLARQLRMELPDLRITLVEKTTSPLPEAAHKVGESSVELASHYFGRTLNLIDYMKERQLPKNGLRFFPGGGHTHAVEDRTEIGPPGLPIVPSYQLDRGRLENDLREMNEKDGVQMILGTSVAGVDLGDPHVVRLEGGQTLKARWVVDAAGRRRLIARKLGLLKESGHVAHASWFRVKGRLDLDQLVPREDKEWHGRDPDKVRWLSTNHLMGPGYWLWFIPLSSGYTSVGIVVHGELHPFDTINSLERSLEWIAKHEPRARVELESYEVADFCCLRNYSHSCTQVCSKDRWALVGEAGVFVDPFYSPGSDFIALANSYTTELIRADLHGEPIEERAEFYDSFYRHLSFVATEVYRRAAYAYGAPKVLPAKLYWDNFNYWSFLCQYYFRGIHKLPVREQQPFVEVGHLYARYAIAAQHVFDEWARRARDIPEREHVVLPPIPSMLSTLHLDLEKDMSADETLAYMRAQVALCEQLLGEIVLRAIALLPPADGRAVVEAVGAAAWKIDLRERLAAERSDSRKRRHRLPKLARDLERCIGKAPLDGERLAIAESVFGSAPLEMSAPAEAE
jgi:flavin-dependent dehydrogenase